MSRARTTIARAAIDLYIVYEIAVCHKNILSICKDSQKYLNETYAKEKPPGMEGFVLL